MLNDKVLTVKVPINYPLTPIYLKSLGAMD